jgi:hypothetical protein
LTRSQGARTRARPCERRDRATTPHMPSYRSSKIKMLEGTETRVRRTAQRPFDRFRPVKRREHFVEQTLPSACLRAHAFRVPRSLLQVENDAGPRFHAILRCSPECSRHKPARPSDDLRVRCHRFSLERLAAHNEQVPAHDNCIRDAGSRTRQAVARTIRQPARPNQHGETAQ